MWQLYQTAKVASSRPSDLLCIADRWAALQFDNAVTMVGLVLENASQEQHNVGSKKEPKYELKYTMHQLLSDSFRLPARTKPAEAKGMAGLMAMKGVKVWGTK